MKGCEPIEIPCQNDQCTEQMWKEHERTSAQCNVDVL